MRYTFTSAHLPLLHIIFPFNNPAITWHAYASSIFQHDQCPNITRQLSNHNICCGFESLQLPAKIAVPSNDSVPCSYAYPALIAHRVASRPIS
mmetsp:Transcript_19203/g.53352  ORF Transcript_19203/g.53352 Transcript_19203/m.53352 type:complete len:93 (+) Transcript_19203:792-1070(+)